MIFALGGLAAAYAVAVVLRSDWNPWPWMGAVVAASAAYYWGPKAYDAAKKAYLHPHLTADEVTERWFARLFPDRTDPLSCWGAKGYCKLDPSLTPRAYFDKFVDELRPYFVPINGSDKLPTFNRVHPSDLPDWMRLVLLPDLAGFNPGGQQMWRISPPVLNLEEAWNEKGQHYFYRYFKTPNQVFAFKPINHAPDVVIWEKAYPRIKFLFNGARFFFRYDPKYAEVQLITWAEGMPEGRFVGSVPAVPGGSVGGLIAGEVPAEPLPYAPLRFVSTPHPQGHLAEGYLYLGDQFLDRAKGGHWLKIADLNNTLVMGTAGFGKSVFLNQVLEGVFHNQARFDRVYLVDLKGGVELWPYRLRGDHVRVIKSLSEVGPLVTELVAMVEQRLDVMREEGHKMWPGPKTLFVVDEYAQIQLAPETTKEERQDKQAMLANLNKLSMLCRAAGVVIWAQLQKGTTDVMDSSFRANLANQVCFKVPNKLTAAGMFGTTDELMVDPVKLPKGRFVFYDASNGETHYLQARVNQ